MNIIRIVLVSLVLILMELSKHDKNETADWPLYYDRNRREIEYVYEYQLSHGGQNRFDKFRHFEKNSQDVSQQIADLKRFQSNLPFIMSMLHNARLCQV